MVEHRAEQTVTLAAGTPFRAIHSKGLKSTSLHWLWWRLKPSNRQKELTEWRI